MLIVACTLFSWQHASAQTVSDFSGTWTLDTSRSDAAAGIDAAPPARHAVMVISESPDLLRIDTTRDGEERRFRFPIDASEEPKPVGVIRGRRTRYSI